MLRKCLLKSRKFEKGKRLPAKLTGLVYEFLMPTVGRGRVGLWAIGHGKNAEKVGGALSLILTHILSILNRLHAKPN